MANILPKILLMDPVAMRDLPDDLLINLPDGQRRYVKEIIHELHVKFGPDVITAICCDSRIPEPLYLDPRSVANIYYLYHWAKIRYRL